MKHRRLWIIPTVIMPVCFILYMILLYNFTGERIIVIFGISSCQIMMASAVLFAAALVSLPLLVIKSLPVSERKKLRIVIGIISTVIAAAAAVLAFILGLMFTDNYPVKVIRSDDGKYAIAEQYRPSWIIGGDYYLYVRTGAVTYTEFAGDFPSRPSIEWKSDRVAVTDENDGDVTELPYEEFYTG